MSAQTLDLLHTPLDGLVLVEASAGTGKTFSITWLYLRALLERRMSVDNVLVVTFSEAAADELRSRLRARLVWASAQLMALDDALDNPGESAKYPRIQVDEDLGRLHELSQRSAAAGSDLRAQRAQIELALADFDQASVFTIHGWCRRVIGEFPFECAAPIGTFEVGDDHLRQLALIEDFWRSRLHADRASAVALLEDFETPEGLLQKIRPLFWIPVEAFDPREPHAALQLLHNSEKSTRARLATQWTQDSVDELLAAFANKKFGMSQAKKDGFAPERVRAALSVASECAASDERPVAGTDRLELLSTASVKGGQTNTSRGKGLPLPDHPLLAVLGELADNYSTQARLRKASLLMDALNWVQSGLVSGRESDRHLGFDALIGLVAAAVAADDSMRFCTLLRARYPLALVDEFQDTDQTQFAIFRKIYQSTGGLLMIGDAKQAIYRFRGGDVFAYAKARQLAADRVYSLDANYRSEPVLTAALNRLFGEPKGFGFDFIQWNDVGGRGPKGGAYLEPPTAPLRLMYAMSTPQTAQARGKHAYVSVLRLEAAIADAIAGEIAQLLHSGASDELRIGGRAVQADDIAVLVNKHDQADRIEEALRGRNIPSSRLSRESIYASVEANELSILMRALLFPNRLRRVRAALATEAFGWSAARIAMAQADDSEISAANAQFHELAELWMRRGPLALVRSVLTIAAARLLTLPGGERRIANWLQLGQLLDVGNTQGLTPSDQLIELERRKRDPQEENASERLQLDSDSSCVHIATIHASKGLEYPIVFAPFLWRGVRVNNKPEAPVVCHEDLEVVADLGSVQFAQRASAAADENCWEDMRRAYVACTRAINRLYLVWGRTSEGRLSPLARLLRAEGQSPEQFVELNEVATLARLRDLAATMQGAMHVTPMPSTDCVQIPARSERAPLVEREFSANLYDPRQVQSFTRLLRAGPDTFAADHDTWIAIDPTAPVDPARLGGRELGICLHAILEQIDTLVDPRTRRSTVAQFAERYGFGATALDLLERWVYAAVHGDLLPGLRLATVAADRRVAEMEFHFAIEATNVFRLSNPASVFADYAAPLHLLIDAGQNLHGWLTGFVDLIVEHEDRYYVIDYKSNDLGSAAEDYRDAALRQAMAAHRYDLQALLYLLALHRYLRLRLGARYQPGQSLGGALYLFVRGMDVSVPGQGVYFLPAPIDLIEALDDILGAGA